MDFNELGIKYSHSIQTRYGKVSLRTFDINKIEIFFDSTFALSSGEKTDIYDGFIRGSIYINGWLEDFPSLFSLTLETLDYEILCCELRMRDPITSQRDIIDSLRRADIEVDACELNELFVEN